MLSAYNYDGCPLYLQLPFCVAVTAATPSWLMTFWDLTSCAHIPRNPKVDPSSFASHLASSPTSLKTLGKEIFFWRYLYIYKFVPCDHITILYSLHFSLFISCFFFLAAWLLVCLCKCFVQPVFSLCCYVCQSYLPRASKISSAG